MATDQAPRKDSSGSKQHHRLDAVPSPAVRRLSLYLRELEGFLKQNRQTTSSKELGEALGYTDSQVRKDLAYFGQFGQPGIGYRVAELVARIRGVIGTDRSWNTIVVGVGNLGQALLTYRGFAKKGFRVVAVFDNDPAKIGQPIGAMPGMEILPVDRLAEMVAEQNVRIGVITVPAEAAQPVADALVAAGIKGILNFAPAALTVPEGVSLASVELSGYLEQLAFYIHARQLADDPQ